MTCSTADGIGGGNAERRGGARLDLLEARLDRLAARDVEDDAATREARCCQRLVDAAPESVEAGLVATCDAVPVDLRSGEQRHTVHLRGPAQSRLQGEQLWSDVQRAQSIPDGRADAPLPGFYGLESHLGTRARPDL